MYFWDIHLNNNLQLDPSEYTSILPNTVQLIWYSLIVKHNSMYFIYYATHHFVIFIYHNYCLFQ